MHDHAIFGINGQPCHVAHQVGRKFGSELAAVLVTPEQLSGLPIRCNADNAQISFRIIIDVLEILTGAGNDKDFADDRSGIKAQRDGADNVVQIQIFGNLIFIQQILESSSRLYPSTTDLDEKNCSFP